MGHPPAAPSAFDPPAAVTI